ncbi:hypothetical protein TNCV_863091 [Trichonephila clavipes]|nr:hypothetical protein TNCV_863091 [Trichonephila clavipes]
MLLGNFVLDYFRVVQIRRDFSRLRNIRSRCLRRAPTPVGRMSARVQRLNVPPLKRISGCGSPLVKVSDHGRHVMSSSPVPPVV